MKRSVEGILFDLDNTLADRELALLKLCRSLWEQEPGVNSKVSFEEAHRLFSEWDADGTTFPKRKLFDAALSEWGDLSRSPGELETWYYAKYPTLFAPDPRVLNFLEKLDTARIPWSIVTNGPPFQLDVIQAIGLGNARQRTIVSALFGSAKPDPRIFKEGLRTIGLEYAPADCLFVGDNPESDIRGAAALGMQTAWVNRGLSWSASGFSPDIEIDHVADLIEVLGL